MVLEAFDPLIAEWFERKFGRPTEPQVQGWPEIRSGGDVLISAPTGSGKTLAAFLICLDGLVRAAREGALPDEVQAVYVSPLKALSNDIHKNLERPLAEIRELAAERGVELAPIRTAVRTGDTPAYQRQKMLTKPPHILVTTPESLFILLTAKKSREALKTARTLIVDEIHAVADDKRGSHLALSIERLTNVVGKLQRVGLSATVSPLEEVARFLSPQAKTVQIGHTRPMELGVEVPGDELGAVTTQGQWDEIRDRLAELILRHRTTLVFVNTRRLAERLTHALEDKLPEGSVLAHHGSLSRKIRLQAEEKLKSGELRAVVATASLELGIDVGTVDLTCQISTPRSIAVTLQRIGRSGHWVGALPHGRIFATSRDDLLECAALVRAIRGGRLDRLEIPTAPLDVLAQQIVAELACEDQTEDECFEWVRRAYPYRALPREKFDEIITMLGEGIATARGRSGAYLHHDRVNRRLKGRRGARLAAITSGGAIPDSAQYQVIAEPQGGMVGMLDEDFAIESSIGDIFLLGATSWRIRRVEPGRVRVEDAHGAAPTVPFWLGEAPGRTWELSQEVGRLRRDIDTLSDEDAIEMLTSECALDRRGAEQAVEYVRATRKALGAVPTDTTVVAERFFDESGGMQLVLHSPFGARVNRAWGLSLRKRFCRSFNLELQAAANDNGVNISLTEQHAFPLELVFEFLSPETLEHTLTQALLDAPMFTTRWRWNVSRSLAVPRFSGGRKTPPPIQRMRAEDLLASVFPDQAACAENLAGEIRVPDHPLVAETIDNCLREAMDLDRLTGIIGQIRSGEIESVAVDTPEPSPFSHELLNANPWAFLDDAPLEERRARAVQMRQTLSDVDAGLGALSAEAIAQVGEEIWPVARDEDELHDALLTLTVMPPAPEWEELFGALVETRRAALLDNGLWVAAERLALARRVYPGCKCSIKALEPPTPLPDSRDACVAEVLRGWLDSTGPATAAAIADRLMLPPPAVALAQLESEGQAMQGRYSPDLPEGEIEWCSRRVLARIHRLTLRRLRREIEPVTSADFMRFALRWQHVTPGGRLHGADGTLQILKQLQGYEAPAAAWEAHILPARVKGYVPGYLDELCLSGEVMWGRLSPHPALEDAPGERGGRRVRPTRAAPLSVFLREEAPALIPVRPPMAGELSHPARELFEALQTRGASFFAELSAATGRLASEVEEGLWELVAAGLVTADGFDNLRSLIDPKRRAGQGRGRLARPRHAGGRWALLARGGEVRDTEAFARQLLARWGVVFRDLMKRESLAPAWRDMLVVLRRMEARGEVRGGRFVAAFLGEQFALPEALDLMRAVRRSEPGGEELRLSAADPLNLAGVVLPGPRVPQGSGRELRLRDGVMAEDPDRIRTSLAGLSAAS